MSYGFVLPWFRFCWFFFTLSSRLDMCARRTFGTAPAPSVILWHAPAKWLRKMRSHGNYERRRENSSSSPDSSEFHFDPLYRARSLMVLRFVFDKRTTHRNDKEIGCRSKCSANERREDKNRTTNTVSACTTHRQHHHNDAVLRCGAHARHGKVYFIPILLFILLRCRKRMFLRRLNEWALLDSCSGLTARGMHMLDGASSHTLSVSRKVSRDINAVNTQSGKPSSKSRIPNETEVRGGDGMLWKW